MIRNNEIGLFLTNSNKLVANSIVLNMLIIRLNNIS